MDWNIIFILLGEIYIIKGRNSDVQVKQETKLISNIQTFSDKFLRLTLFFSSGYNVWSIHIYL